MTRSRCPCRSATISRSYGLPRCTVEAASQATPRFSEDTKVKLRNMLTTGGDAFYHVMTRGYKMTTEEASEFAISLF